MFHSKRCRVDLNSRIQTRRPGGAYRGRAPQMTACAPPNENCAPQARTEPRRNQQDRGYWSANRGPNWWFLWTDNGFQAVFGMKTFVLEITCFRPEKPPEFAISAGKSLWIFASPLVQLIQTGINFSCPRAPLEFTQNKLLVPPQNLFLPPPQSRYPCAGPGWISNLIINFTILNSLWQVKFGFTCITPEMAVISARMRTMLSFDFVLFATDHGK